MVPFSYSFLVRKSPKAAAGFATLYLRIQVQTQKIEVSLKRDVLQHRWDIKTQRLKGNSPDNKEINSYLDQVGTTLHQHYKELVLKNKEISATSLKKAFLGETDNEKMLVSLFKDHNEQIHKRIGVDYKWGTYERYRSCQIHVEHFLKLKKKVTDIALKDLNLQFVTDFELYLKIDKKNQHNTAHKYLMVLKKVIRLALLNGWTNVDPFAHFKITTREVNRDFLTKTELATLEQKEMPNIRLNQVKDCFIFSCYTGLAYADLKKLTLSHIKTDDEGRQWIIIARTKTESQSKIPLLPKVKELINKYVLGSRKGSEYLLPVLTNQKMNSYLKEIADICNIHKKLTTHVARHTFATTVTLTNNVPLETVSKLLGHRSILMTQHYAKVVDDKVAKDMDDLLTKLQ